MSTKSFTIGYPGDVTEEKAFEYVLQESGLEEYLTLEEHYDYDKKFKVTLTVEEVK